MRSRSTCDIAYAPSSLMVGSFQSQMRSRSTCDSLRTCAANSLQKVSISDEKPLHMRRAENWTSTRPRSVSISDEKPLHMRLGLHLLCNRLYLMFQSQMRSRSTCDHETAHAYSRR